MKRPLSAALVSMLLLGSGLACQLFSPTPTPAPAPQAQATLPPVAVPTKAPTATVEPSPAQSPVVTASAVVLTGDPVVEVRHSHEEGDNPKYTIDIDFPVLVSPDGPAFNQAVEDITTRVVTSFKENASAYPTIDDPNLTSYNSVNIYTSVLQQDSHILSVYLEISEYYRGAAHPSPSSTVVNYSLDTGSVLSLGELFQPDVDYLMLLSDYCTQDLQGQDWFVFPEGAQPNPDNYRNWNITPDGLQITFDPYQVAPYAAGFIRVTVPYTVLKTHLNPNGPLGYMTK